MKRIRIVRRRKKEKYAICPQCNTKIILKGRPGQRVRVECPTCGEKGIVVFKKEEKGDFETIRLPRLKKITLSRFIWIIFSFILVVVVLSLFFIAATGDVNFEIMYVSIFIGIVVIRELTDEFTPAHLKKKVNIILSGFLIVFLLIVINKIIGLISAG